MKDKHKEGNRDRVASFADRQRAMGRTDRKLWATADEHLKVRLFLQNYRESKR